MAPTKIGTKKTSSNRNRKQPVQTTNTTVNQSATNFGEPWDSIIKDLNGAFAVAVTAMVIIYALITIAASLTNYTINYQATLGVSLIGGVLTTTLKYVVINVNKGMKRK